MIFTTVLAVSMMAISCDDTSTGTDPDPDPDPTPTDVYTTLGLAQSEINGETVYDLGNGEKEYPFSGDATLDATKKYRLRGWVYITDGSSITIPAGTVIFGEKATMGALIVERGGKIHATGTADSPIVFTSEEAAGSRSPGDWGGIILCGYAKNNQTEMQIEGGPRSKHGGSDDSDSSGELQYVRIEFAGYPLQTDQEINGLTLGSVGSGTTIDHVQVSYSNDDSYEWFGGAVNMSHIIAYHGWDDDFDADNGYSGKVQYALAVRNPGLADTSLSNSIETDNNSSASAIEPYTTAQLCNVTLVGPIGQDDAFYNIAFPNSGGYITGAGVFPNNGSSLGQYQAGIQIRRNSRLSIQNSIVFGYPVGAIIENDKIAGTQANATATGTSIQNVFFGGYQAGAAGDTYDNTTAGATPILAADANKKWENTLSEDGGTTMVTGTVSFTQSYILEASRNNTLLADASSLMLNQPNSLLSDVNFGPTAGSPVLSGVPSATGFDDSAFAGAFKSDAEADNWTKGWANFDPQNTDY